MRTTTLLTLVTTSLLLALATRGEDNWKKIENSFFSFSLPQSFKKTDQHGIDSFVEEYAADGIKLDFDFGDYSNNFEGWPKDTRFQDLKVDGKAARIGTAPHAFHNGFAYSTQVHIKLDGGVALSMFAACKSEKEVALARKVFETIKFKAKTPNKSAAADGGTTPHFRFLSQWPAAAELKR
jgi:hypothetical protein